MASDLEKLEKRLADVEAKLELYQMFSALAPTIDSGADSAVADFFAEDAVYRTDVPGVAPATGRAAIEAVFHSPQHSAAIAGGISHALGPPHIMVAGDKAEVVAHSVVHLRDGNGWRVARVASNLFRLERRGGRWVIISRDNRQLGSTEARDLFGGAPYDVAWRVE